MAGTGLAEQRANEQALREGARNLSVVLRAAYGPGPASSILGTIGQELVGLVRVRLSTPGTGRVYRRGKVAHRASAPGEPPAVDTGRLRSATAYRVGMTGTGRTYVDVGVSRAGRGGGGKGLVYAPMLEFGTRRMRPRPYLRPTIEAYRRTLARRIVAGLSASTEAEVRRRGGHRA